MENLGDFFVFYDFQTAKELSSRKTNTFEALIMAAVRIAPSPMLVKLRAAFPELVKECIDRGNDREGKLTGE